MVSVLGYWRADGAEGRPVRRIGNEDLYQLFFYAQRLQHRYQLPKPPAAFIVSPVPADDELAGQRNISQCFREIVWRAGQEVGGSVKLVLLPMTQIVRLLAMNRQIPQVDLIRLLASL